MGMLAVVEGPKVQSFLGPALLGGGLDALITANILLAVFPFKSDQDAYVISVLSGLALGAADAFLAAGSGPPARSGPTLVEVASGRSGQTVRRVKVGDFHQGRSQVVVDLRGLRNEPIEVRVLDAGGRVLASATGFLNASSEFEVAAEATVAAVKPPALSFEVRLEDPERERVVAAELGGELVFTVRNEGGRARKAVLKLQTEEAVAGLSWPGSYEVGDLASGESKEVRVPLDAQPTIADGSARLKLTLEDANGFDAPPRRLSFQTRALRLPELAVEDFGVDNHRDGIPRRGEQLEVKARIRNKGPGKARELRARLSFKDPALGRSIILLDKQDLELPDLVPGAWTVATYSLMVKNSYEGANQLPLEIRLSERHAKAARVADLPLTLDQGAARLAEDTITPLAAGPSAGVPDPETLGVDVDMPIGKAVPVDPSAVAVVIGIERYNARIPGVPFALRDAAQVREHLQKLIGVSPENTIYLTDEQATKGAIQTALEAQLPGLIDPGKSDVYVYYAGHGAPDPESKTPYLVPHDGNPSFASTSCYPMASFYKSLATAQARSVTVMLDACFSGQAGRGEKTVGLLASGRPVGIHVKDIALPAGVSLLAAGTGDQVSSAYPSKRHGLFTYFLLKGLRGEAGQSGRVTVGDLGRYLGTKVPPLARRQGRQQTPVVLGSGDDRILVGK